MSDRQSGTHRSMKMEDAIYKKYVKQVLKYPLLSFEDEIELSKKIQTGDSNAQMKLVQANLRLVISIARKFENPYINIMDLIQEGNIGLLTAARKYHYSYNTRFSTYAYAWIKQSIVRYVHNKAPVIMLPNRKEEVLRLVHAEKSKLYQILGRDPSCEEVAEAMNMSADEVKSVLSYAYSIVSLNSTCDDDGDSELADIIPDTHYTPEGEMMREMDREEVHSMVEELPAMEQKVIFTRFNFANDRKIPTLRQLGDQMGVSAETVRQMEIRAIRRLQKTYGNNRPCLQA